MGCAVAKEDKAEVHCTVTVLLSEVCVKFDASVYAQEYGEEVGDEVPPSRAVLMKRCVLDPLLRSQPCNSPAGERAE